MEGAGASADEDALRAYLEEHPMPQRRSEEEGEEDEEEGEGDAAGAAAERDAEERRVQRHLLGTMMESAGPFPFERGLREMEDNVSARLSVCRQIALDYTTRNFYPR